MLPAPCATSSKPKDRKIIRFRPAAGKNQLVAFRVQQHECSKGCQISLRETATLPCARFHKPAWSHCNRDKSPVETAIGLSVEAGTLLHNVQLRFLVGNERVGRHALHQKNITPDRTSRPH